MSLSSLDLPPVCNSSEALAAELALHSESDYCVYLGHRPDWNLSTSYRYMNGSVAGFRYVPADPINDGELVAILDVVVSAPNVLGLNITSPYKNHESIRAQCSMPVPDSVNFCLRSGDGLLGFELNGRAFVSWFEETEGPVADRQAVVCGAGGSGIAIAARLAERGAGTITLIDPVDRFGAIASIPNAKLVPSIGDASEAVRRAEPLVFILAMPRESGSERELGTFLRDHQNPSSVFVDIRVDSDSTALLARRCEWRRVHTGDGMNEYNDSAMLQLLLEERSRRKPEARVEIDRAEFLRLMQDAEAAVKLEAARVHLSHD